jgi:hypothetical protein
LRELVGARQGVDVKIVHPGDGVQGFATVDPVLPAVADEARPIADLFHRRAITAVAAAKRREQDYANNAVTERKRTHE